MQRTIISFCVLEVYEHNPKTGKNAEKLNVRGQEPILLDKVRQEDVLAELRRICKVQGIEDQYPELAHAVLHKFVLMYLLNV